MYSLMLVSRLLFLMAFGSASGCPGLETKHFAKEVLQKSTLTEVGVLTMPDSIFHDLGWPWDQFSCGS